MKIFCLCDGNDPACKKTHCYKIGGECRHTQNLLSALYRDELNPLVPVGPDRELFFEQDDPAALEWKPFSRRKFERIE